MSFKEAFLQLPTLETKRLKLRPLSREDAKQFYEIYADCDVTQYLDWNGADSAEVAETVIGFFQEQYRKRESMRWGIELQENRALIGTLTLGGFRRNAIADIGYDLAKRFWGKGYATEAVQAALDFCWQDLGLHRVQAYVQPGNLPSVKLLLKLGFEQEGLLRKWGYQESRKQFFDVLLFALVR